MFSTNQTYQPPSMQGMKNEGIPSTELILTMFYLNVELELIRSLQTHSFWNENPLVSLMQKQIDAKSMNKFMNPEFSGKNESKRRVKTAGGQLQWLANRYPVSGLLSSDPRPQASVFQSLSRTSWCFRATRRWAKRKWNPGSRRFSQTFLSLRKFT